MKILFHDLYNRHEVSEVFFSNSNRIEICRKSPGASQTNKSRKIFDCRVMSRNHAVIFIENNKFFIRDMKSSNGTFVNNSPVSGTDSAELFTDDVVQFGVIVGCHLPVRARIEIFNQEDQKYRKRDSTVSRDKSNNELDKLNNSISSMEKSEQLVSVKLEKLESIIDNIKNIYTRNSEGTEILHKLQIITKSMENLNTLIDNKIFEQKDIEQSIKNILNDLIKEVVLNNLVQEEKQREILDYVMNKLEEMPKLTEEDSEEEIVIKTNVETKRSSSPIVFFQDDDIPELICSSEPCNTSKSILKPPRSPRISSRNIRINTVPEVREIEDDDDKLDDSSDDEIEVKSSPPALRATETKQQPATASASVTPRKRCWAKRASTSIEETAKLREQLFRNSELTLKPGDFERSKIEKMVDSSRESRQEVQVTINHGNKFYIQGLVFSVLLGFMIIFLGLEKNPRVLEYW